MIKIECSMCANGACEHACRAAVYGDMGEAGPDVQFPLCEACYVRSKRAHRADVLRKQAAADALYKREGWVQRGVQQHRERSSAGQSPEREKSREKTGEPIDQTEQIYEKIEQIYKSNTHSNIRVQFAEQGEDGGENMEKSKREVVTHRVRIDEYTAIELAIPKDLSVAEFAGLFQKAKRLFNIGGKSFDDAPEVEPDVKENVKDAKAKEPEAKAAEAVATRLPSYPKRGIGIWSKPALKLLHGPCKNLKPLQASKIICAEMKSNRFSAAAIYNRRYYERVSGIKIDSNGNEYQ